MMDYRMFQLVHAHDGERFPMVEATGDATEHDPERGWIEGERIFRCAGCDAQVVVVQAGRDTPDPNLG